MYEYLYFSFYHKYFICIKSYPHCTCHPPLFTLIYVDVIAIVNNVIVTPLSTLNKCI